MENISEFGSQNWPVNSSGWSDFAKHIFKDVPSRLLAVLRVCRVCSHHCIKVSCWLLLTPWNNFSSFSSSSTFLLARPLKELLHVHMQTRDKSKSLGAVNYSYPSYCKSCFSSEVVTKTFLINTWGWRCLCCSSACCLSWLEEAVEQPPSQLRPRSPCWSCGCRPRYCWSLSPS